MQEKLTRQVEELEGYKKPDEEKPKKVTTKGRFNSDIITPGNLHIKERKIMKLCMFF